MPLLGKDELLQFAAASDGWQIVDNKIIKEFVFKNFVEALAFVLKAGVEAEKNDHHPEINLHSWNKVTITLSTHSQGGVTEKDTHLAKIIDDL